jgi:basic membrane protein A
MNVNAKYLTLTLPLLTCAAGLSSCSDDDDPTPVAVPEITVMFSPGGLGDSGYNDLIMRGVQQVYRNREDVDISCYSPTSAEEAAERFVYWREHVKDDGVRELYVLAGSDYEDLAQEYVNSATALPEGKEVLLFESNIEAAEAPISTFRISMYGGAYLGGKAVAYMGCKSPVIFLANPSDQPIRVSALGFTAGYGAEVPILYLADDWHGYTMPDSTYRIVGQQVAQHDFIFGVAGGSNVGIYRYFREYPAAQTWTAGMDVDQSAFSDKIIGSLVKHIDRLIVDYLNLWIDGGSFPKHTVYGLESGYEDWVVGADYGTTFGTFVEDNLQEAIQKEEDYEATL